MPRCAALADAPRPAKRQIKLPKRGVDDEPQPAQSRRPGRGRPAAGPVRTGPRPEQRRVAQRVARAAPAGGRSGGPAQGRAAGQARRCRHAAVGHDPAAGARLQPHRGQDRGAGRRDGVLRPEKPEDQRFCRSDLSLQPAPEPRRLPVLEPGGLRRLQLRQLLLRQRHARLAERDGGRHQMAADPGAQPGHRQRDRRIVHRARSVGVDPAGRVANPPHRRPGARLVGLRISAAHAEQADHAQPAL